MKAEDIMDIIDDADCNADTCYVDSERKQQPLGWTTKLIEISFKAGIKEAVEKMNEILGAASDEWKVQLMEWSRK